MTSFNPYSEFMGDYETAVYSFMKNKHLQSKPVFFGVLYHGKETTKYFVQHGFKTVPYITVSNQKVKRLEGEEFYKEEDKWHVRGDEVSDATRILEFLNKRLGTNVPLTYPISVILAKNLTFLIVFVVLLATLKYLRMALL
jgi:hypothetical protein